MKGLLMIMAYSVLLSLSMSNARAKHQNNNNKPAPDIPHSISFASHIIPLLQKKCSPCHFEGGKMYGKMPFDKAATLLSHPAGILKRFSDENEKALLEKFVHVYTGK